MIKNTENLVSVSCFSALHFAQRNAGVIAPSAGLEGTTLLCPSAPGQQLLDVEVSGGVEDPYVGVLPNISHPLRAGLNPIHRLRLNLEQLGLPKTLKENTSPSAHHQICRNKYEKGGGIGFKEVF